MFHSTKSARFCLETGPDAALSYVKYSASSEALQGPIDGRSGADLAPPTLGQQPAAQARQSAPGAALDAALTLIGLDLPLRLVPVFGDGSSHPWAQAASSRGEILARRADWRRAVGVADVSGSLIALDPDSAAAELVAAELVGDGPAGFRIQSRRGVHRVYLRGAALPAAHRANLVHDERRPAEALAPKLDVVAGAVTLWKRGKTWLGEPSSIGPMPDRLRDAIAACWAARSARIEADAEARRKRAELAERERQQRAGSDDADRLRSYAAAALAGIQADASALLDGQRGRGIYAAAFKAGRLVGASWSGMVEADAEAAMLAAIDACGYDTRKGLGHAKRGIRAGMRDPLDPPASRELVRATMPHDRLVELERRAAAACADTRAQARAAGIHPRSANTAAALAAELARRAIDEGRPTVYASMADLGLAIDRGAAAVSRAAEALESIGWTVTRGGIGDADRARATAWTLPKATGGALPQNETLCGGASDSAAGGAENPSDKPRFDMRQSPGIAARGLRRRLGELPGCGDSVGLIVDALGAAAIRLTVAALADLTGLSVDTVRRCCRRLKDRGAVDEAREQTAGRPASAFALTDAGRDLLRGIVDGLGDVLAATVRVGERAVRRAAAAIDAGRALLAEARELAQALGVSVAAALAQLRARLRRFANAERDPLRELTGSAAVAAVRRAEGRAQLIAGAARRAWLEADLTRQAVASVGLVPAW